VDTIVFDKTGTLTLETMALQNPQAISALEAGERGILLGMVEHSLHPVASCLREQLLGRGTKPAAEMDAANDVVGAGLEVHFQGNAYRLGKPGWAGQGTGDSLFTRDGEVLAAFQFGDAVREDAAEEFRALRSRGYGLHILSGDRAEKVARMAVQLGLPGSFALGGLSPDDKAARIGDIGPQRCLMIGDGANDSLAFNTSLCTGTPAIDRGLLERKADFYFLGRGLRGIRALIDIANCKRIADRTVLSFAIAYNVAAVALSILGKMTPLLAAILMPLSGLVTIGLVLVTMRNGKVTE
jgi:Cu2+-exporting ATPase